MNSSPFAATSADPLVSIDASNADRDAFEQLTVLMKQRIPATYQHDFMNEVIVEVARNLCVYFSLKEIDEGREPTSSAVARYLRRPSADIGRLLNEADDSPLLAGTFRRLGEHLQGFWFDTPRLFNCSLLLAQQRFHA